MHWSLRYWLCKGRKARENLGSWVFETAQHNWRKEGIYEPGVGAGECVVCRSLGRGGCPVMKFRLRQQKGEKPEVIVA